MEKFNSQTTLAISESYDLPTQEHRVQGDRSSYCDCFHKKFEFRVWQIMVFLLIIISIIAVLIVLLVLFGPGNSNLKKSTGQQAIVGNPTNGGDEHTSTKIPTEVTTGQTTKEIPCQPLTTGQPTTTATPTSVPRNKTSIQCGVAIVGGGTAGLLMSYILLKSNKETNVCIFEKENRLGGKIFDHRFPDAPNVTVGLGEWHVYGSRYNERDLMTELSVKETYWGDRKIHRVEARGVYADSFDSLKSQAFPTLLSRPPTNNKTVYKTAELVDGRNASVFPTAGTFLSSFLSPEGAKWIQDAYGFEGSYMEAVNPESYKKYLKETLSNWHEDNMSDDARPEKGMSELIEKLRLKVRQLKGKIYLQEAVTSVSKEANRFVLLTKNFTVEANKTVLTAGPEALKKINGDVMQGITNHDIFKSIVSVPAFRGAAVYPSAWWNDSVAAQKNNSLQFLHMFVSSSNCLGITMPYNFRSGHPNESAVLHTIANNGGCSDKWGNILKIGKDAVDKEMKRALEYTFQRTIPEPLDTVYKYWEEGFWYLQKPGTDYTLSDIRQWAKGPLVGSDVFLVGRAFYNFGGWLEDDILSTDEALKQGWNAKLPW